MQIYTKRQPFYDLPNMAVMFRLAQGVNPSRPTLSECFGEPMPAEIWTLVSQCWETVPCSRPNMARVLKELKTMNIDGSLFDASFSPGLSFPLLSAGGHVSNRTENLAVTLTHPRQSIPNQDREDDELSSISTSSLSKAPVVVDAILSDDTSIVETNTLTESNFDNSDEPGDCTLSHCG
jgi:hypothetical protein